MRNLKNVIYLIFMSIFFILCGILYFNKKNIKKNENINKETIMLASFNVLRLGEKEKDYRTLAKIISKFDIIGLEEVMNEKGLKKLRGYLEKETKSKWEYFISENSVGSENYREYYGYIYKKDLIDEQKPLGFYDEKNENEFMREPYGMYFKVKNFDFVFILAHSIFGDKEKQRVIEASNYINVYEYFMKKSKETDIIIAGDFNLPGNDFGFRNLKLRYNVEPLLDADVELTTFSDTKLVSSYDNFFINKSFTTEFTGKKGVYNYLKNNNKYMKQYISDHLLIFSEYNINEDRD